LTFDEVIAVIKSAIEWNPNVLFHQIELTTTYGELGRDTEARAAVEVPGISPKFTVDTLGEDTGL
jgi:hypothetical protein